MEKPTSNSARSVWSSRLGFILASAGSAVGLGAIWKFPYMAGTNGGSVFMLPYIFFTLTIGLVLLIGEMSMGRYVRKGAASAYKALGGRRWGWLGLVSVATGYFVLAFYSVVGGWCVYYLYLAATGNGAIEASQLGATFDAFVTSGSLPVLFHLIFLGSTALVVYMGVEKGIERVSKVLMPLLFFMMLALIIRGLTLPNSWEGIKFLFAPNFSEFTSEALLNAMGFAFFSLSVGSASMMNYGSYLSKNVNIPSSTTWVVMLAIISSILGGLMIMPAVFAFGLDPNAGPGLTFVTMPAVFASLPAGQFFAVIFYLCLYVAALTSAISILEMSTQYFVDEWKFSRKTAVCIVGSTLAVLGVLCALSFGPLADVKIFGKTFFDFFDYMTSNIGMPLGCLGIAIVAGYVAWPKMVEELRIGANPSDGFLKFLRFVMVVLSPIVILAVTFKALGFF